MSGWLGVAAVLLAALVGFAVVDRWASEDASIWYLIVGLAVLTPVAVVLAGRRR